MTITYNDLVTSMGTSEVPIMNPMTTAIWPYRAFVTMGKRPHGDNVSATFKASAIAAYGDPPSGDGTGLLSSPWEAILPWVVVSPSAANRCTNAGVMLHDAQVQYFSIAQQKWIALSSLADRYDLYEMSYFVSSNFNFDANADKVYATRYNLPLYSCVKTTGDRTSEDSGPPTTSKYRLLHNGVSTGRIAVDWDDIGGIFVSVAARMISVDGAAYNSADNELLLQVGADYYPELAYGTGAGMLTSLTGVPAVGGSGFQLIPTDGTSKHFYFVSANINDDTYFVSNSDYVLANGGSGTINAMSAATLQANVPQIMSF